MVEGYFGEFDGTIGGVLDGRTFGGSTCVVGATTSASSSSSRDTWTSLN